jgi:hypothetical protein
VVLKDKAELAHLYSHVFSVVTRVKIHLIVKLSYSSLFSEQVKVKLSLCFN